MIAPTHRPGHAAPVADSDPGHGDPRAGVPAPDAAAHHRLAPYVPRLVGEWMADTPSATWRELDGSLVFADVSGFTALSEHLATMGRVGAEVLADLVGSCFGRVLGAGYANGGSLLKFGGDALLLLFTGPDHAVKACRAAAGMRVALREIGRLDVEGHSVGLRMSTGVHSGRLHLFLVGRGHRELIVAGPGASRVVAAEALAGPGAVVVSADTAAALPRSCVGAATGDGFLLRRSPPGLSVERAEAPAGVDGRLVAGCVPPAVRELLLGGHDEPEHRLVTVAFLRFGGTDRLVAERGPAGAAVLLAELLETVQDAAARYDVCVLGSDVDHDGGKIILIAGAPTSTGADEERVLLALRRIAVSPSPLPLQAGVNRGHVFAGDVGPVYRRTYTVMGDAVNLAARLMARAAPGQVLAAEPVVGASRTRFATTAPAAIRVKGKTHPVRAVAVGPVELPGPTDTSGPWRVPLVGRTSELGVLIDALASAQAGTGRLVEMIGEPGMGKSRLVEEVAARAAGMVVHRIVCDPFEVSTPYFPFRGLLRTLAGIAPQEKPGPASLRLREAVAAAGPGLVPWAPLVGAVAGVDLPATAEVAALDDRFRRERLEAVTTTVVARLLDAPTLLVVEDAHWMDEASAALLRRLVDGITERPWLVCITRCEGGEGFATRAGHRSLRLRPLDAAQARLLVDAASEHAPMAPHEVAALAARAGGNPLFLEELVAAARRARTVEELPDSVERVIVARIDALPPRDRALVRHLSVMGPVVECGLAAAVLGDELPGPDAPAWRRVASLVSVDDGVIRFRHALVRDAAYDGLPYRIRRRLHARVAENLERAGIADAAVLSLHFFHSGRFADAWRQARIAGDRARAVDANAEAAELYERALRSGGRAGVADAAELAAVHEALGDARTRLGAYAAAEDAYRACGRLVAGDAVRAAAVMRKRGRVREVAGGAAGALRLLRRARRLLDGCGAPGAEAERAQLAVAFAAVHWTRGRIPRVVAWCERAVAEATRGGDRDALAHAYYLLDAAHVALGHPERAVWSAVALELYEELDDLWGQGVVLNNLGTQAYWEGRWDDAVSLYERGRDARERIGDAVNASMGTVNVAEILSDQGRVDEAEPLLRSALRISRASGDLQGVAFALSLLGRGRARRGAYAEALEMLIEARSAYSEVGGQPSVVETDGRIAECHVLGGDTAAALDAVDRALSALRSCSGAAVFAPALHRVRGQALAAGGDVTGAREELTVSLELARARGMDYEEALTLRALARVAGRTGEPADHLWTTAAVILERLGVVAVVEPLLGGDVVPPAGPAVVPLRPARTAAPPPCEMPA